MEAGTGWDLAVVDSRRTHRRHPSRARRPARTAGDHPRPGKSGLMTIGALGRPRSGRACLTRAPGGRQPAARLPGLPVDRAAGARASRCSVLPQGLTEVTGPLLGPGTGSSPPTPT